MEKIDFLGIVRVFLDRCGFGVILFVCLFVYNLYMYLSALVCVDQTQENHSRISHLLQAQEGLHADRASRWEHRGRSP